MSAPPPENQHLFRAVANLRVAYPRDRPDLLLVELGTLQGPVRLSLTKGIAVRLAEEIAKAAQKLAPDRSAQKNGAINSPSTASLDYFPAQN
jgi:hypothetical protein